MKTIVAILVLVALVGVIVLLILLGKIDYHLSFAEIKEAKKKLAPMAIILLGIVIALFFVFVLLKEF